ncbi:MAG: peptidylprolyl isomerase [Candidatus Symbiothrix sp.]|nr:peptidylprolyl isomerase [Candidatus Symbiothrix sp.]
MTLVLAIGALVIGNGSLVTAQKNVIDEVIWVIGDDAIFKSDVEMMRQQMLYENQRIEGDPYCFIPEQIAIQKLYLHQAKLDSISIPESDVFRSVDAKINNAITRAGSKERLEQEMNKPLSAIREDLRTQERERYMVQLMQRDLVKNVKVTPSDVRTFYDRIPKDSLPFIPTSVEVEIITNEPVISLAEIDYVKERLRDYTEQVTSGKRDFSTLARLYSEDKGSAVQGGELGFMGKGQLVPEFAAAAFELNDPKRVSRIVESEYGYHIIQLIEKRGDRANVRHILLKPQVTKEELVTAMVRLDSIRTDIVEGKDGKTISFEEAVPYISQDKDTRMNNGLMVNGNESERYGTSHFEMAELPMEMSVLVDTMKVGDISHAFTMKNTKQKDVVAIVKLKSRTEGHKASLSEDYQALKGLTEDQKRQETLEKWLAQKQKDTYIRINEKWQNCDFQFKGWVKSE